jgi:hypothetical protein
VILTYRPISVWPDGWDRTKPPLKSSPFDSTFTQTLDMLDTELYMLDAKYPTLQVDAPDARIRMDGQLHAQAQVGYPGVILSFTTPDLGTLTYACNRFGAGRHWSKEQKRHVSRPGWHENLRAIALGLEALRKLERYGIADRGQQYAGWAALGSGIPMGPTSQVWTDDLAWTILCEGAEVEGRWAASITSMYRKASKIHHPDNGGDAAVFDRITKASAEGIDVEALPSPGAISICGYCGDTAVYAEEGRLRPLTDDERETISHDHDYCTAHAALMMFLATHPRR